FSCGNFDSQNRSTCAGKSRSSATSPMVRKAEGLFAGRAGAGSLSALTSGGRGLWHTRACRGRPRPAMAIVDLVLQRVRGAEHQDPARTDRHLLPGFRVAADALSLLANGEAAKGRNLDHFAAFERLGNLGDHRFDKLGRFISRQPNLLINRLGE